MLFAQTLDGASKLIDYGAIGLLAFILIGVIIALLKFVHKVHKEHQMERAEWREMDQIKHKEMLTAFEKNSSIISELSTIIKSRD